MVPINQFNRTYIQNNGYNQPAHSNDVEKRPIGSGFQGQSANVTGGAAKQDFIIPKDQRVDKLKEVFDEKTLKRMGVVECQTCANRVYQDGSNDPGVSFKSPTHLDPSQAASAVASHEQEHVTREQADAKANGREVISQSVQIFTSVCPECGKTYVSGGVTKTTTANAPKNQSAAQSYQNGMTGNKINGVEGNLLDFKL